MGAIVIALAPLHTVMKILAALFVGGNAIFTSIWIVGTAVAGSVITREIIISRFLEEFIPFVATYLVVFSYWPVCYASRRCHHALISQPFLTLAPLCHVYERRNDYPVLIVVLV